MKCICKQELQVKHEKRRMIFTEQCRCYKERVKSLYEQIWCAVLHGLQLDW